MSRARYVDPGASLFLYGLAVVVPPIAVGIVEGCSTAVLLNLGLWIFGWFPGVIHACFSISRRTLHKDLANRSDLEAALGVSLFNYESNTPSIRAPSHRAPTITSQPPPAAPMPGYQWVQMPIHYVPTVVPCCQQAEAPAAQPSGAASRAPSAASVAQREQQQEQEQQFWTDDEHGSFEDVQPLLPQAPPYPEDKKEEVKE